MSGYNVTQGIDCLAVRGSFMLPLANYNWDGGKLPGVSVVAPSWFDTAGPPCGALQYILLLGWILHIHIGDQF